MKQNIRSIIIAAFFAGGISLSACKNKAKDSTPATNSTSIDSNNATYPAPVTVAPDAALVKGVEDATKDYPGVTATVNNGEVTLTGVIEKDRLQTLMQSIHALNPKKVNNELTIK